MHWSDNFTSTHQTALNTISFTPFRKQSSIQYGISKHRSRRIYWKSWTCSGMSYCLPVGVIDSSHAQRGTANRQPSRSTLSSMLDSQYQHSHKAERHRTYHRRSRL